MDPQTDLPDLVEDLEVNIDELTSTLTPLLPPSTLSLTSTTLPLLEKAKLHVLAAYSIESTLFSTLVASGADARSHALFAELARLKTYFAKIKDAEAFATGDALRERDNRARLDVGAAQRFIRHGLSGNERYDELRKERVRGERERGLQKARAAVNRKFGDEEGEAGVKRGVHEVDGEEGEGTSGKKVKRGEVGDDVQGDELEQEDNAGTGSEVAGSTAPARKKRGRPAKKDKAASTSAPHKAEESTPARATRSAASKGGVDALGGESPAPTKGKGKGKGKGKAK